LQEDSFLEDNEDCWDQHILELPVPAKDFCKTPDGGLRELSSSRTAPGEPPPERQPDGSSVAAKRTSLDGRRGGQTAEGESTETGQRKCCESARAANKANVLCAVCSAEFCDAECFLLHSQYCKVRERAENNS